MGASSASCSPALPTARGVAVVTCRRILEIVALVARAAAAARSARTVLAVRGRCGARTTGCSAMQQLKAARGAVSSKRTSWLPAEVLLAPLCSVQLPTPACCTVVSASGRTCKQPCCASRSGQLPHQLGKLRQVRVHLVRHWCLGVSLLHRPIRVCPLCGPLT